MKILVSTVYILMLIPMCVLAQPASSSARGNESSPHPLSVFSPFYHLSLDEQPAGGQASPPFACPVVWYYDQSAPNTIVNEQLPVTSEWAIRVTPPPTGTAPCTVWTINVDFFINNAPANAKDTMFIFVREVFPPYANIYTTHFIARPGENLGEVEIDPPSVPPFGIRPILNPKRDVFVGFKVKGDASHNVDFKFKTPSIYPSPPRSVKFLTPSSFVPATAGGGAADFVLSTNVCCNFIAPPVELSLFTGVYSGSKVQLRWKTDSETNNFQFEVQRAEDPAGPWTTRAYLPGRGTTTEVQHYAYLDSFSPADFPRGVPPALFYRLKQMDFDGTFEELPAIRVVLADVRDEGYRLHPSFPNPMSATTAYATIRYQIPLETSVRLGVYDALGREVSRIVDEVQPAGLYDFIWSPAASTFDFGSGLYYIRLKAGEFIATDRISVLR